MRLTNFLVASLFSVSVQSFGGEPSQQFPLKPEHASLSVPLLGFGTWNLKEGGHNASKAVEHALKTGYRHLDCAAVYGNEKDVGRGIARGLDAVGLDRSEVHITSKLWNNKHSPEDVEPALDKTLSDLGLDYLDLYLMHWPVASADGENKIAFLDTWEAMVMLLATGKVKHIGVSNFSPAQLSELIAKSEVKPEVHQMELHPYLPQSDWLLWHQAHGIHVTAYSPLGNMNPTYGSKKQSKTPEPLLKNDCVKEIAKRAGCPVSNVALAWGMYRGTSVIPKSQHPEYIEENFEAGKCDLSFEDLSDLGDLGREWGYRFNNPSNSWDVPLYEGLEGV